jgi:prophage regulatory protein
MISLRQLCRLTGLSHMTIYRMRRRGEIPAPIQISPGRMAWREDQVRAWLEDRKGIAV